MDLRITSQTQINRAIANQRQQTDRLGVLFEQASSGKRLLNPSDDPLATLAVLTNKAQVQKLDTYLANIQEANTTLSVGSSALQQAVGLISEARRLALDGAQTINDADTMNNMAEEADALLTRMLELANSQHGDRFVFSGTATSTAPFAVTSSDSSGHPLTVAYQGAAERAEVAVSQQQNVATRYTGSEVFQQRQRAATVYTGTTGAAPGTGTDSATGQGTLVVDAIGLTISLNGGTPVAYTGVETNLPVIGPAGEVAFVDTTGITTSGTESLDFTGTYDVFQVLIALRDDLRNTSGMSPSQQVQSIGQRLTELDRHSSGILKALGEQGTNLQNLGVLETHVRDIKLETRKIIGNLEDADVTEVITKLQAQQNQLQLTLAASARLFDQSLLDFLR